MCASQHRGCEEQAAVTVNSEVCKYKSKKTLDKLYERKKKYVEMTLDAPKRVYERSLYQNHQQQNNCKGAPTELGQRVQKLQSAKRRIDRPTFANSRWL